MIDYELVVLCQLDIKFYIVCTVSSCLSQRGNSVLCDRRFSVREGGRGRGRGREGGREREREREKIKGQWEILACLNELIHYNVSTHNQKH